MALFLFAMFIGGTCKYIMSHRKVIDTARENYTAIHIARNQLEQIRNTRKNIGYSQIFDQEETGIRVGTNGDPSDNGRFMRITEITEVHSNLAEIAISVQIQDRISLEFSTNHMEEIVTFLSRQ